MSASDRCDTEGCTERAWLEDSVGKWCTRHADERWAAKVAAEKQATIEAGGPWPQTCPRRNGSLGPWERGENLDTWDVRDQLADGVVARHCSFCGSLHPDDLIRLVRDEGYSLSGTDKSYKFYVEAQGRQVSKFYRYHLSEDQRHALHTALGGPR